VIKDYRLCCILIASLFHFTFAQEWQTYQTSNTPLPSNQVRTICIDSAGVKWFGTTAGLAGFDNTHWVTLTTQDNLADNSINKIVFESSTYGPAIWLATDNGVSVLAIENPDAITCATPYRSDNTGLVSNKVLSVAVDTGHVKWFGTNQGLSIFTGSQWETYTVQDLLPNNVILSISTKFNGWNYLATRGGGVARLRYDGIDGITGASAIDTEWSSIASDTVNDVLIGSDEVEWFGTPRGTSRHKGSDTKTNWTTYRIHDGLIHDHVLAIAEDLEGGKWFGTAGGLSRLFNDQWQSWTTATGLAGDSVNDITVDLDGSLWLATNNGISHMIWPDAIIPEIEKGHSISALNMRIYPNPFNNSTCITFTLSQKENVSLYIYNIIGQKISTLYHSSLQAGIHEIFWDGTGSNGSSVISGIYFVQMQYGQRKICKKLMIIQ